MPQVWPNDLPTIPDTVEHSYNSPLIRFPTDAGPAKQRRRFRLPIRHIEVQYLMTPDQYTSFRNFYLNTIKSGQETFTWPDLFVDGTSTVRMITEPEEEPIGWVGWKINFSLEVLT